MVITIAIRMRIGNIAVSFAVTENVFIHAAARKLKKTLDFGINRAKQPSFINICISIFYIVGGGNFG